ncbi:MAG: hypothetical protein F3745_00805 [Nitrospinae bacterium]|nr:hypothetical protein [Nitrospinota bacterium]
MRKLLKFPAVILFCSAFYTWITYDEYISYSETLFPWLNFQGVFKQMINFFLVCIQGALGAFLWQLSEGEEKAEENAE